MQTSLVSPSCTNSNQNWSLPLQKPSMTWGTTLWSSPSMLSWLIFSFTICSMDRDLLPRIRPHASKNVSVSTKIPSQTDLETDMECTGPPHLVFFVFRRQWLEVGSGISTIEMVCSGVVREWFADLARRLFARRKWFGNRDLMGERRQISDLNYAISNLKDLQPCHSYLDQSQIWWERGDRSATPMPFIFAAASTTDLQFSGDQYAGRRSVKERERTRLEKRWGNLKQAREWQIW